jgi:transposase InsO family protein
VSDAFTDGGCFRIFAVVDDFTRECLALVADTSLNGARVARELDALIAKRGRPRICVSNEGTELTSMAILGWTQATGGKRRLRHTYAHGSKSSSRAAGQPWTILVSTSVK